MSPHTYYRFRKQELSTWELRVEVLEVRAAGGEHESGGVRLAAAGQAHDLGVKLAGRVSGDGALRVASRYAPGSSSGDAFVAGVDLEDEDGLEVNVTFGKGRHAVRAAGVLRLAVKRAIAPPDAGRRRPLWVDVARAPVDVGVGAGAVHCALPSRGRVPEREFLNKRACS